MKTKFIAIVTLAATPVLAFAENTEATGEAITIWNWLLSYLPF